MVACQYLISFALVPIIYILFRAFLQLSCCNIYLSSTNYRYYARFSTFLRILTLVLLLRIIIGMEIEYRSSWTNKQTGWHYCVASIIIVILTIICTVLLSTTGMYSEDRALVPGSIPSRIIINPDNNLNSNTTMDNFVHRSNLSDQSTTTKINPRKYDRRPIDNELISSSAASYTDSPVRISLSSTSAIASSPSGTPNYRNNPSSNGKYDYLQTYKTTTAILGSSSSPGIRKNTTRSNGTTYTTSSPLRQQMLQKHKQLHSPSSSLSRKTNNYRSSSSNDPNDPQLDEPITIVDANGASSIQFAAALYAGDVQAMAKAAIGIVTHNGTSPLRTTEGGLTQTILLPPSSPGKQSVEDGEPLNIIPLVRRQPMHNTNQLNRPSTNAIVYSPSLTNLTSASVSSDTASVHDNTADNNVPLPKNPTSTPVRTLLLRPSITVDNIPANVATNTAVHPNSRRLSVESIPGLRRSTFVQTNTNTSSGTAHASPLRPLPIIPFGSTKKYEGSPRSPKEPVEPLTSNNANEISPSRFHSNSHLGSSLSSFTVPRSENMVGKENKFGSSLVLVGKEGNGTTKSYVIDPSSPAIHKSSSEDTGFTVPTIDTPSIINHQPVSTSSHSNKPVIEQLSSSSSSVVSTAVHTPTLDITTAPPTPELPISTTVPSRRTSNGSIYIVSTQGLAGIHALLAKAPKGTIPFRNPPGNGFYPSTGKDTITTTTPTGEDTIETSMYDWNAFTDIDDNGVPTDSSILTTPESYP